MKKILFDHSIFLHQSNGGISKYISHINKKLKYFGVISKIYSPLTINENLSKKNSNEIFFLKIKKIPKFLRKFFFLINDILFLIYVFFFKPDLIHFSYYNNQLVTKINIPYVITVYDLIHEKYKIENKQFSKLKMIENASHIICISEETKKDLLKIYNIDKEKISVIYLGIDKVHNYNDIKEDYILYVGDRGRYKNFETLISAFSESKFLKENFKLVCFGGGKFKENELKIFESLKIKNNLIFKAGDEFELLKTYRRSRLYVSLSLAEGFGITNLEAMSTGCPVLCSKIPIFEEILLDSCEYVEPTNVNQVQSKIEKILKSQSEQKNLINKGYKRIENFSWEKCALDTSEIYKKILNEK